MLHRVCPSCTYRQMAVPVSEKWRDEMSHGFLIFAPSEFSLETLCDLTGDSQTLYWPKFESEWKVVYGRRVLPTQNKMMVHFFHPHTCRFADAPPPLHLLCTKTAGVDPRGSYFMRVSLGKYQEIVILFCLFVRLSTLTLLFGALNY